MDACPNEKPSSEGPLTLSRTEVSLRAKPVEMILPRGLHVGKGVEGGHPYGVDSVLDPEIFSQKLRLFRGFSCL